MQVDQRSLTTGVERTLKDEILAGQYPPGSRLPPERVLAARFGVTRVTLRSGLTRLVQGGLLEVRQGRGYTVRDFRRHGTFDLLEDVVRVAQRGQPLTLVEDLLRLRRGLVLACVDALPADPEALLALRAQVAGYLERMNAATSLATLTALDLELTQAVVSSTHSVLLQLFLNPQQTVAQKMSRLTRGVLPNRERMIQGWKSFLAWLGSPKRDPLVLMQGLLEADRAALEQVRKKLGTGSRPRGRRN